MTLPESDDVLARPLFRESIRGLKLVPPRKLPSGHLDDITGRRPLGWSGDEYRKVKATIGRLKLKGLEPVHLKEVAAMMTVAIFLQQALLDFNRARNRANAVLKEMRRLSNVPRPWRREDVAALDAAVALLDDDPCLSMVRFPAFVAAGAWPLEFPLRNAVRAFRRFLAAPGQRTWHQLQDYIVDFEDFAARIVGETPDVAVDVDSVARFLFPGGQPAAANNVGRWASWAVGAFLEAARETDKGANRDASAIIDAIFPNLDPDGNPIDVDRLRYKGWKSWFGGKVVRVLGSKKRGSRKPRSYANSPSALWLMPVKGMADRFEALI
jgi:hypothetical protein